MLDKKLSLVLTTVAGLGISIGLILHLQLRKRMCTFAWQVKMKQLLKKEKNIHIISQQHHWEKIAEEFCQ